MDKYKKYLGIIIFIVAIIAMIAFSGSVLIGPRYQSWNDKKIELENVTNELNNKLTAQNNVLAKLRKLKESIISSQKRIYSPIEDKLGNDTLFFTLYSDVIEMVRANTIRIKSIDYEYNPKGDLFVAQGEAYFVCDVNMEVVSNYVNLGKLIQDLYQYPYYIRINSIDVTPYPRDKKILIAKISLRLYSHTSPDNTSSIEEAGAENPIEGATSPLPQE